MASPVFHGCVGAGLGYCWAGDARLPLIPSLRSAAPWLAAGAALACLPDIDYLPGLLWLGNLNAVHQRGTHSLAVVLAACAVLWLAGRVLQPSRFGVRAALFLFLLVGSHLAIDLVTADYSEPVGMPLWAPVSDRPVHAPFSWLPAWSKDTLADLGSTANLRPVAVEAGAGLLVAAACVGAKRSWTRRRTPL